MPWEEGTAVLDANNISRFNTNSADLNKYAMGNTGFSRMNANAQKLGLDDNRVVHSAADSEVGYELDGTKKEKKTFEEKGEEISKSLGKKIEDEKDVFGKIPEKGDIASEAQNHANGKHDGFDKDCPQCECETCKNRRYQDDSNDSGVSFQMATRMDPKAAASRVRAHETEHVRREQYDAKMNDRKVISQSVQILTRNCPECGTAYVAGGLTRTHTKKDIDGYHEVMNLGNEEKLAEMSKRMDFSA